MVGTTGVTAMHGGCLLQHQPPEKVRPPEGHLDRDRSDPETVSSPVPSRGSRGGLVTSTGTGTAAGMGTGRGEENSREGGGTDSSGRPVNTGDILKH